jgi:hypothetical protein
MGFDHPQSGFRLLKLIKQNYINLNTDERNQHETPLRVKFEIRSTATVAEVLSRKF